MRASITGISCLEHNWRPASSGYTVVSFVPKLCASA